MKKQNPILLFNFILVTLLAVVFFIHTSILSLQGFPKYGNSIILSYLLNFLLAAIIYIGLFLFRNRIKTQIGFVFIAGSFLKFLVFFLVFYPGFKVDGNISSLEFAAFFVPYAICLSVETIFMAKMLQKMDKF
ncbi:DUF6168 family protein [Maribacter sp. PR1]|uniref:DUF6168 family protein n=1 Tax=Maribacter cobaltidurans TaxID=1178778 RepID=A0ABU7J0V1_9FLAO|nr:MULTISPECIES: DUF6168 family protein [Maribacter]MDC6390999.1 DUF6168 family protein [Maribacter sp. PR1]MEE1978391.1 DUF6168 family protein [Maribacter cobaltidurans]